MVKVLLSILFIIIVISIDHISYTQTVPEGIFEKKVHAITKEVRKLTTKEEVIGYYTSDPKYTNVICEFTTFNSPHGGLSKLNAFTPENDYYTLGKNVSFRDIHINNINELLSTIDNITFATEGSDYISELTKELELHHTGSTIHPELENKIFTLINNFPTFNKGMIYPQEQEEIKDALYFELEKLNTIELGKKEYGILYNGSTFSFERQKFASETFYCDIQQNSNFEVLSLFDYLRQQINYQYITKTRNQKTTKTMENHPLSKSNFHECIIGHKNNIASQTIFVQFCFEDGKTTFIYINPKEWSIKDQEVYKSVLKGKRDTIVVLQNTQFEER